MCVCVAFIPMALFLKEYSGMLDCARKTVAQHGPQGLYRGALPLILGSSGKQAARWTGYETAANAMKDDRGMRPGDETWGCRIGMDRLPCRKIMGSYGLICCRIGISIP